MSSSPTRRVLRASALLLAGTVALSGCSAFSDAPASSSSGGGDGTPSVAASFYPLQFVAQRVGGDLIDLTVLTGPGQEPHDLELTVAQTATIAGADLVLLEEALQPVVADAVDQNGTGSVLDVEDVITLRALAESHEHGDEDGDEDEHADDHADDHGDEDEHADDHGDEDPHFWLDPALMAELADAVAQELAEIDPEHAEDYSANAATLSEELEALDSAWASGLAECERDVVVVSHDAFGYLTRYGLDFHGIAGLSPDAEPTPADLGELQALIRDEGITTVFSETLAPRALSETLARDAGVETAVLDPIEGLSDETAEEDYLSIMEANLEALQEANGCR